MTTVAGIARAGVVVLAADTLATMWDRPLPNTASKLVTLLGGRAAVGIAGDIGLLGMLAWDVAVPDPAGCGPDEWAHRLAAAVTGLAMARGLCDGGRLDGNLLLGRAGRLWHLNHAQAVAVPDGIAAVGSGEAVAMGAMDALLGCGTDPQMVPRMAVRIACIRDQHTAGPVDVVRVVSDGGPDDGGPDDGGGGPPRGGRMAARRFEELTPLS